MKKISNNKGFAILELALVLVALFIVAGTGWYVINSNGKTDESLANANSQSSSSKINTKSVPEIKPAETKDSLPLAQKAEILVTNTTKSNDDEQNIDKAELEAEDAEVENQIKNDSLGDVNVNF
jgi:hypothetical protein